MPELSQEAKILAAVLEILDALLIEAEAVNPGGRRWTKHRSAQCWPQPYRGLTLRVRGEVDEGCALLAAHFADGTVSFARAFEIPSCLQPIALLTQLMTGGTLQHFVAQTIRTLTLRHVRDEQQLSW